LSSQKDEIPAELLSFIHHCIDSVEGLQVLLLLLEKQNTPWTVESLSHELRSSHASVFKRLLDLETCKVLSAGALSPDGTLSDHPISSDVKDIVNEIAALYRLRPHRVIAQIYARPPLSIQSFAEAFRLKKEDK
jgi:hypothetical protein